MAGLDPAIHVFERERSKGVDGRNKCGHDGRVYEDSSIRRHSGRAQRDPEPSRTDGAPSSDDPGSGFARPG
jgi:hypothetical protein